MKLPKPRLTVRRLMIAVAVVAFSIGGWQVYRERQHRLRVAALCQRASEGSNSYDVIPETERLLLWTVAVVGAEDLSEGKRRRQAHWSALQAKYENAARYPWLPMAPDTSEPPLPGFPPRPDRLKYQRAAMNP